MTLTAADAIALTAGRDMWSTMPIDHAGIPSARMADGPMGVASSRVDERDVSVLTPSGVSLGATWDVDLVARVGAVVGGEAKARGIDLMLAPNLNLARSPLAGRAFELYSEDPLLAGTLGVAWIGGLQSRNVGAVAKHLVCNDSETERDRFDAVIDEAALREVYLLPFEMAAAAGCAGIMAAYNKLNGTHCAENARLLTDIVRDDWGFPGFTVCDWYGTRDTVASATAGLDLEMPGPPRVYGAALAAAIAAGTVDTAAIDAAAARVAAAARRWAGGDAGPAPGDPADILAEAAAASFVVLRNDGGLLPIAPGRRRRIAVIGPNATAPCYQGGTFAKIALRADAVSPIDAIRARFGGEHDIVFAPGADPSPRLPTMAVTPARDIGDGCTRGVTVDFFDSHDFTQAPVFSETRDTNSLTWFAEMPGIGALDHPAGIRASGRFTPAADGAHRFHIGGTGAVRLKVDGHEVFADDSVAAPADLMGILKSGDSASVTVDLVAGREVLVECAMRFAPARAQGLWYGIGAPGDSASLLADAEAAARDAEIVILVVGETGDSGVESRDRATTRLADDQRALIGRVCAANGNVVIVANVAHAFDTGDCRDAAALMVVWYPGEEFGPALAAVLAGDREPSGRLPVSFAAAETDYPGFDTTPDADARLVYVEATRVGYRGMADRGVVPAHGFGAGLGYGAFDYADPAAEARVDGSVVVSVAVTNHGPRNSAEVVQVYRRDSFALAGFVKQVIPAGRTATVEVRVDPRALRRWDGGWKMPSGTLRLAVGRSATDLRHMIDVVLPA